MLSVQTNLSSLEAQTQLQQNTDNLNKNLLQLSTGYRINSAADDPAGLFISQALTAQVNGTAQAQQNVQTGINVIQSADGALGQIQNIVQNIRGLVVEAANDTNGSADRASISTEITKLEAEINQISKSTTFNGTNLLGASAPSSYLIQVGANSTASTNTIDISSGLGGGGASAIGLGSVNVTTNSLAAAFLSRIDTAVTNLSDKRANLGAFQNRLDAALNNLSSLNQNFTSARSTIQDTDIAATTAKLTQNQILQQAAATVLLQANQSTSLALTLLKG